jgi:hypothetical protein
VISALVTRYKFGNDSNRWDEREHFAQSDLTDGRFVLWDECSGTQSQYPFVFDSVHELKRYGLALVMDPSKVSAHFGTPCYYYGNGGWDISISDALLSAYKSQDSRDAAPVWH